MPCRFAFFWQKLLCKKEGNPLTRKKALLTILSLALLVGVSVLPVSAFSLRPDSETSGLQAQNPSPISDLFFDGLDWSNPAWPLAIEFITDGNAKTVSTPGIAYLSSAFQAKPSAELFAFYYLDRMRSFGWQYVSFIDNDFLMEIQYYNPEIERGLDVRIGNCILLTETNFPAGQFCVQVWVSSGPITPMPKTRALTEVGTPAPSTNLDGIPATQSFLSVPFYSQRALDPNGQIYMGYGNCAFTLYDMGCTVTAYAMIYNYYQAGFTDPVSLNESLKQPPGVFSLYKSGCYIYWPDYLDLPDAPSGVYGSPRVYNACQNPNCLDEANAALIDHELQLRRPIHARVHWAGQDENHHSVVIIGHIGNQFYIRDPLALDSSPRTLSSGVEGEYIVDYLFLTNGIPPKSVSSFSKLLPMGNKSEHLLQRSSQGPRRFLQ